MKPLKNLFCMPILAVLISIMTACDGGSNPDTSVPAASTPESIPTTSVPNKSTILAIGDSFFEWHVESQQSIPGEIGKALQISVDNRAMSGANFYGDASDDPQLINVKDQYQLGSWDWVVINGGGNDVNEKCQCNSCEGVINELISIDATSGELPSLVAQMLQNEHKVLFVMYPEIPVDAEYGFEQCGEEFIEVEYRVNQLALNTENFWLISSSDVVPTGDDSYFVDDLVHPSTKSTEAIGQYIAATIQNN